MSNPLLAEFKTPFDTAPFSKIKNEHFKPAFIKGIQLAKDEIDAITNNSAAPTFENTLEAMEFGGEKLDRISSIFFNLNSAETSEEIQKMKELVGRILEPIGKKVHTIANYDNFNVSPHLLDEYVEMVKYAAGFYESVTRYTTSAFLRMKLGDELQKRGVAPHIYESKEEAHKALADG